MSKILKIYEPYKAINHNILKYYAESLNENEVRIFISECINLNGWVLATEIARNTNSNSIITETIGLFDKMLSNWISTRLMHSQTKVNQSSIPYIPKHLKVDFTNILNSLRNLEYPETSLNELDKFIGQIDFQFLSQYLDFSLDFFVEHSTIQDIEIFYLKLVKNKTLNNNYRIFIVKYLTAIASSSHLFVCSEVFLKFLNENQFSLSLQLDPTSITISSTIKLLNQKKLDFSKDAYTSELINKYFSSFKRFSLNNLTFFKFLRRFNYKFDSLIIENYLEQFLTYLSNNFDSFKKVTGHDRLKYFNLLLYKSDLYTDYFIFCLGYLSKSQFQNYLERFIDLIDQIKKEFEVFPYFTEFNGFIPIEGTAVKRGSEILINNQFSIKSRFSQCNQLWQVDVNFENYHSAFNTSFKPDLKVDYGRNFFITRISPLNKGMKINVKVNDSYLKASIDNFKLNHFFLWFELSIIKVISSRNQFHYPFDLIYKISEFQYDLKDSEILDDYYEEIIEIVRLKRPIYYSLIVEEWQRLLASYNVIKKKYINNEFVNGIIHSNVLGGFRVQIDHIHAFLPGSHATLISSVNFEDFIGKEYTLKVLSCNDSTKNVIVSRLDILKEEFTREINELETGMIVSGRVCNVEDYGVFVNIGGIVGLLHLTEISHYMISNIKSSFRIGQELNVVIIKIDAQNSKIWLGLKQITEKKEFDIEREYYPGVDVDLKNLSYDSKHERFYIQVKYGYRIVISKRNINWQKIDFRLFSKKYDHLDGLYTIGKIDHRSKLIYAYLPYEIVNSTVNNLCSKSTISAIFIGNYNGTGFFTYKNIVVTCPARFMSRNNFIISNSYFLKLISYKGFKFIVEPVSFDEALELTKTTQN